MAATRRIRKGKGKRLSNGKRLSKGKRISKGKRLSKIKSRKQGKTRRIKKGGEGSSEGQSHRINYPAEIKALEAHLRQATEKGAPREKLLTLSRNLKTLTERQKRLTIHR